jgi:hypothetical protein
MHPARGSTTATETAPAARGCAGRRAGTRRGVAVRVLLRVAAFALLLVFPAASAPTVSPIAGTVPAQPMLETHALPSTIPLITVKHGKPPRHGGKASIGLFTASPAVLPPSGGTVHLLAIVSRATTCRFTSGASLKPLPTTKDCASGEASITVRLPKNTAASARTYRFDVAASGIAGGVKAAPVAVIERASPASSESTVITAQPTSVTAAAGTVATFTAAASPASSAVVQWEVLRAGGSGWLDIVGATSRSYSLTATTAENGDEFRAVFTYQRSTATTLAVTLTVTAASSARANALQPTQAASASVPAITQQPQSDAVMFGSSVTFSAAASGVPAPSVQWEVSADGGNTWSSVAGAASTSYQLTANTDENDYLYRAVFTNSAGSVTTEAAVLVVTTSPVEAPAITVGPSDQSAQAGSGVSFTAVATGNPTPSVQWQVSTDGGSTWSDISGADGSSYSFTATIDENDYQYRAVVSNFVGPPVPTAAATLTVTLAASAPLITSQPTNQAVVSGHAATFSASASGNPSPTVQWQVSTDSGATWGAVAGGTSSTLSFTAAADENGYQYRAVFTNVFSNSQNSATTSAATLTVGADQASGNWSGYAATGASFSGVSGSWTVPVANCASGATTYSSQWVGIDGDGDGTVEQDGTESDCSAGVPTYYAWWEMYGDNTVNSGNANELLPAAYPVSPGDTITAMVNLTNQGWVLTIDDAGRWTYQNGPFYLPTPQLSAEWVVERPELNGYLTSLTDFGSTSFSNASADVDGSAEPPSNLSAAPIEMGNPSGALLALPGPLGGDGFSVTWYGSY